LKEVGGRIGGERTVDDGRFPRRKLRHAGRVHVDVVDSREHPVEQARVLELVDPAGKLELLEVSPFAFTVPAWGIGSGRGILTRGWRPERHLSNHASRDPRVHGAAGSPDAS
jgi:hypothetical protein